MDVYQKGLNGSEAAWGLRKYCGLMGSDEGGIEGGATDGDL